MYGVLQVLGTQALIFGGWSIIDAIGTKIILEALYKICLLYTSDAADDTINV